MSATFVAGVPVGSTFAEARSTLQMLTKRIRAEKSAGRSISALLDTAEAVRDVMNARAAANVAVLHEVGRAGTRPPKRPSPQPKSGPIVISEAELDEVVARAFGRTVGEASTTKSSSTGVVTEADLDRVVASAFGRTVKENP